MYVKAVVSPFLNPSLVAYFETVPLIATVVLSVVKEGISFDFFKYEMNLNNSYLSLIHRADPGPCKQDPL